MNQDFKFDLQTIYETVLHLLSYRVPISGDGTMGISIASVTLALLVFVLMFRLSRTAQNLLMRRVLSHVPIDTGLAYTLQQLLHYVVVALGVVFALKIGIGVDFTGLAVVITALSVGIGLGLKEITSDVAAGFVLLFERPVRVGDRVKMGGDLDIEGNVKNIGLRTTKILTNDGLMVIVPNSKLTNENYVNWSFTNAPVRLHVPVGVAYGSDVGRVREALLAASRGVAGVADDPKPTVRLVNFGDSALDFELLVWTEVPETHPQIRSDLNFNIERELREAGIEIPLPQRDLRLVTVPPEFLRG